MIAIVPWVSWGVLDIGLDVLDQRAAVDHVDELHPHTDGQDGELSLKNQLRQAPVLGEPTGVTFLGPGVFLLAVCPRWYVLSTGEQETIQAVEVLRQCGWGFGE